MLAYLTEIVDVYPKIIIGLVMRCFIYVVENEVRETVILDKNGNTMSNKELGEHIFNDPNV